MPETLTLLWYLKAEPGSWLEPFDDLSHLCLVPCSLGPKVGAGSRLVALDAKKGPGDSGGYADPSEYMTPTGTDHFDSNGLGLLSAP